MAMQVPQSLLNAGGTLSSTKVKNALCQVFRKAVTDYCKKPKGKRGYFNKKFFKTLRGYKPDKFQWLRRNIVREMPVLAPNSGTVGVAGTAAQVAAAAPTTASGIGQIANALAGQYSTTAAAIMRGGHFGVPAGLLVGTAGAVLSGMYWQRNVGPFANTALKAFLSPGQTVSNLIQSFGWRLGYPDGMMNFNGRNRVIEIKGPGDSWRQGQKSTFDAVSKPNTTIVLNCKRCKANCTDGPNAPNGGCP